MYGLNTPLHHFRLLSACQGFSASFPPWGWPKGGKIWLYLLAVFFFRAFSLSLFTLLWVGATASGGSGLGSNSPKQVDFVGVGHLVAAATSSGVKTFVLVSSGMAKAAGRATMG